MYFTYRLLKEARLALRLLRSLRKLLSCIPTPCNAGECRLHFRHQASKEARYLAWVLDHLAPYHIHLSHCSCLACSFSSSYRSAEVCRVCQSDYPCAMVSGPLVQGYPVKLTHRAERRYSCKHYPCQYVAYNLAKRCKGNIIPCFESCPKDLRCVYCTKYITWPSEHQLLPLYSYQFFRRHTSINLVFLSINSYRRHVLHFFQGKDICLFFAVRVSLHIYT